MLSKIHLDRHVAKDGTAAIKISFTKNRRNVDIPTGISVLPSQWDDARKAVTGRRDRAAINAHLTRRKAEADTALLTLMGRPDWPRLSAYEVRDLMEGREPGPDPNLFMPRLLTWAGLKEAGTRKVYMQTYRRILAFDPKAETELTFGNMTVDWLMRFDAFLSRTAPSRNARNIHLRNIRTVFNFALDDGMDVPYPFRRFRIRAEPTRHRALSVENLRTLLSFPAEECAVQYVDMFRLTFLLMGINMADLFELREVTPDGRIEYRRAKTHRLYSVKVEPEAMEIISRYRGKKRLLYMADRYSDHYDYAHHMNDALKRIGPVAVGKRGKKSYSPLFPDLTVYWARHSWATIAASLDIPKETIAAGLGHGGNTVTDIYIDFDRRKVDEANRRVIDWVLYGKK
ncbi:MAG: site-specific integrase [Bacteroidales bacterium]|nr:site-specific integrase [Bacteroidales bacterium]